MLRSNGIAVAISIDPPEDLNLRVQHLADARRLTPRRVLQEAVEQYVEREEKREAFGQDAAEAWSHYERTGLHVTGDEVEAWLLKLEAGEDAEPPTCHV